MAGLLALVLAGLARPATAQLATPVTAEKVRDSIDRAARYLIRSQKADGSWPERPLYAGGLSPLCTLALLQCGYTPEDEPVRKALVHLRTITPTATYTTSLQTMAFCAGEPRRDRLLIMRNVKWLEAHQVVDGPGAGMWAIPVAGTPDHTDHSMTHLAMLALYEAERVGVPASDEVWRRSLDYWKGAQNADGSWGWGPNFPGTGSMTCAGIASILVAEARFARGDARVGGEQIACCGAREPNAAVDRAMSWLGRRFSVLRNPGSDYWHSYYLYALERVGRITAQRFIGDHDWYREGAERVVAMQLPTGEWPSDMDEEQLADPLVSTSFSVMFLAKARRPLVLGQLKHEPAGDWNPHGAALSNLVSHVERRWGKSLAYQQVDIARASVEDLLETPVLYLSGRDAPVFSAEEKRKLRMYVDRGGFLFADASCSGGTFDEGFRALAAELFPEPESTLHPLSPSHPLWRTDERVDADDLPELWGIDAACRTAVVYAPGDLSCAWELGGTRQWAADPEPVRRRIAASLATGGNILAYATNREVRYKDPAVPIAAEEEPADAPFERGKIYVANVLHPGGCESAAGAAWTLLRLAQEELGVSVSRTPRDVRLSDPSLFKFNLLLIHGRTSFELTPAERKNLREYLERGGAVLADAVCSSKEFAESFRREMQLVFPEAPLGSIPPDDKLLTPVHGGFDVRSVSRRPPPSDDAGPLDRALVEGPPRLEGLRLGRRYAVIFSPYDLSCALESREPAECEGYTRQDAARIATNALFYFLE